MKYLKMLSPIIIAVIVALIPAPEGLTYNAWLYFAVFLGVIVGLIIEPIPAAVVGVVGVCVLMWLKIGMKGSGDPNTVIKASEAIKWGLAGFSNSTIWLIFAAFMLGLGYDKSGLGKRIALILVKYLGKSTLGLGYAISIADLILAPFIPSNSARSGGTLYPIVSRIPPMMDSHPDKGARKIGAYLCWVSLAATCVTSSMFFTGLAPNLLAMDVALKNGFGGISWFGWFMCFLPAGVILFLITPLLAYWIYPPEIKRNAQATSWASEELSKMGPMCIKEYTMLGLAVFALVFWIGSSTFGVDATTVAVTVMAALVVFRVITWNDLLGDKPAWNTLVWFATLVTLAGGLKNVGFLDWLSVTGETYLAHFSPGVAFIGIIVLFYLIHYFFASLTAHVAALLAVFMVLASKISGLDVNTMTVMLMLSLGIMGILTPYGTGPSPVWYGSGYIKSSEFWFLGFVFGILYLIVFLVVCVPWINMYAGKFIGH